MEKHNKPNVVFILSDDQGAWAMGCSGNDEVRTPHLDRLAAKGIRFENFFCVSPVCSPSRASFLTGTIPSRHGVHDWIKEGNTGETAVEYLQGQTAYTEILAENDYVCGLSGKWHLGDSLQPQKGFTHWFAHERGGGPYYNAKMVRDGQLVTELGYVTDVITDDALKFIDHHGEAENPFYLSVHYTAPHSPWIDQHPQEIVDAYEDCAFRSCPEESPHPQNVTQFHKRRKENLKGYFASITAMDQNIGRILDKLKEKGIEENTLVCFFSDNGFNCGHHGIWGKGNGTFPQNMFDTSVKIPAIMSHPGFIPEGMVSEDLLSGYDFMPTLLEYTGLSLEQTENLPGRSFLPLLRGQASSGRENVVIYDEYGPVRMIRSKDWKYIHRYPYGPHELYQLKEDPNETNNLIDQPGLHKQIAQMKAQLEEWFVQYADPALDGTREPVYGTGQLGVSGLSSKGKKVFQEPEVL